MELETRPVGDQILAARLGPGPSGTFPPTEAWRWNWGEPLPLALPRLGVATASALRKLDGSMLVIDGNERAVTIATGPGVTVLYEAGEAIRTWATHAVASAWVGRGEMRLDEASVPELMACGFVGGRRTHLVGVTAAAPCQLIELAATGGMRIRSFSAADERWEAIEEKDADGHAETAFLANLETRVRATARPHCGLTGGYDSRVVAVGCAELALEVPCFTWGFELAADVAAEIARRLQLAHECLSFEAHTAEEAIARTAREVRWNEGLAPALGLGQPLWPDGITAFLTGGGGELGRAFHYRLQARNFSEPSASDIAKILRFEQHLEGARPRCHRVGSWPRSRVGRIRLDPADGVASTRCLLRRAEDAPVGSVTFRA